MRERGERKEIPGDMAEATTAGTVSMAPSSSSFAVASPDPPPRNRSVHENFLAGQVGGMAGVAAGQPFDTVKVLMQTAQQKVPRHPSTCAKVSPLARSNLRRKSCYAVQDLVVATSQKLQRPWKTYNDNEHRSTSISHGPRRGLKPLRA